MIRKQIFIPREQDAALKRLSRQTGESEAALVREAIEQRLRLEDAAKARWEALANAWAGRPVDGKKRTWRRDDLYKEQRS